MSFIHPEAAKNEKKILLSLFLQGRINCFKEEYETALRAFEMIKDDYKKYAEFDYYYGLCLLKKKDPDLKKTRRYINKAICKGFEDADPRVPGMLNAGQ
ncbi:MAG: hypothetical protein U5Q03_05765 [Bacteroidota bacterium]|nr:hypothetical protein [Bacteroidota bacterium]